MNEKIFTPQLNFSDCGVACLVMILRLHGVKANYEDVKKKLDAKQDGVSAYDIIKTSSKYGINAKGYKKFSADKMHDAFIAHLINDDKTQHFVVVLKVLDDKVLIADPASKIMYVSKAWFKEHYTGIAIIFNDDNISFKKALKDKKLIILLVLITFILVGLSIIFSYTLPLLIKLLDERVSKKTIFLTLFIFMLLGTLKASVELLRGKLCLSFELFIDKMVTIPTINKLIYLPYSFYKDNASGALVSRVNDLVYVKDMFAKMVEEVFVNVILIVFLIITSIFISIKLSLIFLGVTVFYSFYNYLFFKKNFFKIYDLQISNENLSGLLVESLDGAFTIKSLVKESYFCNKINDSYKGILNKYKNLSKLYLKKNYITNLFEVLISIILIVLCVFKGFNAFLIVFIMTLFKMLTSSLNTVFENTLLYANFKSAYKRVQSIFKQNISSKIGTLFDVKNIKFNNVSFSYKERKILNNVSFDVNKGDWVMVCGPTGSGKSTIFKLLIKEEKALGIYVNGADLDDFENANLRKSITYVDQKPKLFKDTIFNNITFNDPLSCQKACKTAEIDSFILKNGLNYNYLIDSKSANISGGDMQKIIIARTLYNGGNMIIFDETTSQLDVLTEKMILKNIKHNYPYKTIILVSHRASNKQFFNKIFTLGGGVLKKEETNARIDKKRINEH